MKESTQPLAGILAALSGEARRLGLNDAQWADAAGVRKETLSRLRGRASCDLATLAALARAVGAAVTVQPRASRGLAPGRAVVPLRRRRASNSRARRPLRSPRR